MEKKVFLSYEGVMQFSNALELLNASINEFNSVADKMVPEKMLNDGLLKYLNYFCNSLEEISNIKFKYNCQVQQLDTSEDVEISLFRSIRTILLMLLRNSQPTVIRVDLVRTNRLFKILIYSDGINVLRQPLFLVSQTLENVKFIIEGIGGNVKTHSTLDLGNTFEIEVQL